MYASRNTVLRYVAGGTGRGLRMMRRMRREAKNKRSLAKFAKWVRGQIPKMDSPENHVHPRHKRVAVRKRKRLKGRREQ